MGEILTSSKKKPMKEKKVRDNPVQSRWSGWRTRSRMRGLKFEKNSREYTIRLTNKKGGEPECDGLKGGVWLSGDWGGGGKAISGKAGGTLSKKGTIPWPEIKRSRRRAKRQNNRRKFMDNRTPRQPHPGGGKEISLYEECYWKASPVIARD